MILPMSTFICEGQAKRIKGCILKMKDASHA